MAWLAKLGAGIWAKLALVAGIVGLFALRLIKAGGDAEKAKTAKAAHDHQLKTGEQVRKSDDAVADPRSARAKSVRERFERDD